MDVQFHPVLGHGSSGKDYILSFQPRHDLLVFQWVLRIFLIDHPPDHLANRHRGQFGQPFLGAGNAGIEKKLQLEDPLGAMEILIGRDATDGRLMH